MKVRIASVCFCLAVVITTAPGTGFAQTLTTIHSLSGPTADGDYPFPAHNMPFDGSWVGVYDDALRTFVAHCTLRNAPAALRLLEHPGLGGGRWRFRPVSGLSRLPRIADPAETPISSLHG